MSSPSTWKRGLVFLAALAAPMVAFAAEVAPAAPRAAAAEINGGLWVYSVKFVCGFNPVNGEQAPTGQFVGEAQVKLGNYATEINIYNPALNFDQVANIRKKLLVLSYKGDARGREPNQLPADDVDFIDLRGMFGTMDDCNRIYQLFLGGVPATPPPILIGYWVLQSDRELDVTAVYTAEVCSDWVIPPLAGPAFMCANPNGNWGAGISIDVERVPGRFVTF